MSKRSQRRREAAATGRKAAGRGAAPGEGEAAATGRNAAGRGAAPGEGQAGGTGHQAAARGAGRRGGGSARPPAGGRSVGRPAPASAGRPGAASRWGLGVQVAFLAAVFAVVVLVAELAGAANLGVALGVGQIAFAIAVMYLLLRR